jgi:alpha-D-ribose 1-methylphosphonate 5-triphosphate synthase subunit PhnG
MNSLTKSATMMPISGRIPEDLYQWLTTVHFEGATTTSDKLRAGLALLRHQQEGGADFTGALEIQRSSVNQLRKQLSKLEPEYGHSEVLAALLEHAPVLSAAISSAQIQDADHARQLEGLLVHRSLLLVEGLMRQAITKQARAYDPHVLIRHIQPILELANIIEQQGIHNKEGL